MNLGTKIKELQDVMMRFYNEAYAIAKQLNCTEMVIHANYKPGTDWYNGWITRAKTFLETFLKDKDNSITIYRMFKRIRVYLIKTKLIY